MFPNMRLGMYLDCIPLDTSEFVIVWNPFFEPFFELMLEFLRDLLMFGITREIMMCIKFIISRVNKNSFWIGISYPMKVNDIHTLIGMSMEC